LFLAALKDLGVAEKSAFIPHHLEREERALE
jgi:hypothetical protein